MTPNQIERIQGKIKKLKAALARDKKQWGGYYHDGQGIRYAIPRLYIQIEDYKGGQRYFNWFHKNFPDDSGYPDFLFEWAIVLFMNGKIRDAERKIFETFCGNTYIIDKFFGREIIPIDKWEGSNLETPEFTKYFQYAATDEKLTGFAEWLNSFIATENFSSSAKKFLEIEKKLESAKDYETRRSLLTEQRKLRDNF